MFPMRMWRQGWKRMHGNEKPRTPLTPDDPDRVTAIAYGERWFWNIRPGSIKFDPVLNAVSFDVAWSGTGELRHYKIAIEEITAYEERELR